MSIKIDEIRSFAAVAETGSFSAAARRIGRAQSVLSMHVAGLEADLGYALFHRTPKPELTARGRELLPSALRLLAEAQRLETRAAALADTALPALYLGIDPMLEAPVMIEILQQFSKAFPSVRLQIENITESEAQWFFRKSGMNAALVFSSEPALETRERILGRSPVSVVVSKNHPLASLTSLTTEALRQHRQIIVHARDSESAPPNIINPDHWEVDSGPWALGLVARGVGWALLPKSLLTGRSAANSGVTALEPPFAIEPARLTLRSKPGEVTEEILLWWEKTVGKHKVRLGLAAAPKTTAAPAKSET